MPTRSSRRSLRPGENDLSLQSKPSGAEGTPIAANMSASFADTATNSLLSGTAEFTLRTIPNPKKTSSRNGSKRPSEGPSVRGLCLDGRIDISLPIRRLSAHSAGSARSGRRSTLNSNRPSLAIDRSIISRPSGSAAETRHRASTSAATVYACFSRSYTAFRETKVACSATFNRNLLSTGRRRFKASWNAIQRRIID